LPESSSFGTSQLKYKLTVEAVSLYFKSSNIGKLFPTSGMVIFPQSSLLFGLRAGASDDNGIDTEIDIDTEEV
jgi:hypothetical protein